MDAFPPQLFQARADRREIIGSAGRGHAPPHLLPMDFDFCRAADWLIIGARTSGARSDRGIPEWCVLHPNFCASWQHKSAEESGTRP